MYHELKPRFAGSRVTACYSSDLTRCRTGADILGSHFGCTPVLERDLRELNIGIWEGMTWDEIIAQYPKEWQSRLDDIVHYRVPQGENLLDLAARAMPVVEGIVQRHPGEEVLVVGHGGINRVILLNAIEAPLDSFFNIEQTYCCFNIIDYYADGKTVVKLLNG
jgi:alpha-ribazole phosphatase